MRERQPVSRPPRAQAKRPTVSCAGESNARPLIGSACVLAVLLCSLPLWAQEEVDALTRAEFQRALAERDAVIAELLRRVLELEARGGAVNGTPLPVPPTPVATPAAPEREQQQARTRPQAPGQADSDEEAAIAELLRPVLELEQARGGAANGTPLPVSPIPVAKPVPPPYAPPTTTVAAAEPPAAPEPAPPEGEQQVAQTRPQAPGQVEVDEEAVDRALDFTLVQEGALLLPAGRAEFTPSFTYTRRTGDFPVFETGTGLLGELDVRRNQFQFVGNLLVGLPFDSQLELALPYNLVDQSSVIEVLGVTRQKSSDTGHGLGDLSLGLAKTVLREGRWWPDVVMRATWDTGTGEKDNNNVALNGGFQELTSSVSLAKRHDPLVLVGGAFYETAFEDDGIEPGNTLGFTVGTFLATSPSTSLRVVLNQSFIDEFKVGGDRIQGSDQVQSALTLGASAILDRNVLVDVGVGVGLTDDSPDYSVSISLPIRFPVPGF